MRALERLDAASNITALHLLDHPAEFADSIEMEIYSARPDFAAANHRHRDAIEAMEQCAEHQDRSAVAARMREGDGRRTERGSIDHQLLLIGTLNCHADGGQHIGCNINIADSWNVR